MKLTIEHKNENLLLRRTELQGSVHFDKETISNLQLQELISKSLNVAPELIIVKNIYARFGTTDADFRAIAYANAESKTLLEPAKKEKSKEPAKKKGG